MPDIFLARFVAETEPYDDDLTQMEEERPTKRPCIEGNVFVLLLIIFILLILTTFYQVVGLLC